jgi:hypothetical protein
MGQIIELLHNLVYLLIGLVGTIRPYYLAKIYVLFHSIGSERPESEIDPEDWFVLITRILSFFFLILGVWMTYIDLPYLQQLF